MTLPADLPTYPGLFPPEVPYLRAWLAEHQAEYDRWEYNVRVGSGFDPGPAYPDYVRKQSVANTQFRIDVIAWKGNQATLIEVKQHAGAGAVGQLLTYYHLWQEGNPGLPAPGLLVVTGTLQPDLPRVLAANGIAYEVVTPQGQPVGSASPAS